MKEINLQSDIDNHAYRIKEQVIHEAYKWSMFVFIPYVAILIRRIFETGFHPFMIVIFLISFFIITCVAFKNNLYYWFRAITLVMLFCVMGLEAVFNNGLMNEGTLWIIFSLILSILLFSKKTILLHPLQNNEGHIPKIQSNGDQIRKLEKKVEDLEQTEKELKNENEFTNTALNAISDVFFVFDASTGEAIKWNKSFETKTQYNSDEIKKMKIPDSYLDEQDLNKAKKAIIEGIQNSYSKVELNLHSKNGEKIPFEYSGTYLPGNSEIPNLIIVTGRDISERKEYEKKITLSENRYRLIIEKAPIVIWITSKKGNTDYVSPNVQKVCGYTEKELLSGGINFWLSKIHEEDAEYVKKSFRMLFGKNIPFDVEYRIKTKNGRWIWLHDKGEKGESETGQEVAYGVFTDITDRKLTEQTLKESEKKYRKMFQSAGDAAFILQNDRFIDCNEKALKILNIDKEKFIGTTPWELSPPIQPDGQDSNKKAMEKIHAVLNGIPQHFEWQHKLFDNSLIDVEISLNVLDREKGTIISIWRDITERKQLERKIYNARIEAEEKERERFAKEIHDGLGPILSSVKFNFEWLSETTDIEKRKLITEMGNKNIDEAFISLKEISNDLNPHILNNFGLFKALGSFIEKISLESNVKFSYTTNCNKRLNPDLEIALYRIVQELINNTLKYANAQNVYIDIAEDKTSNLLSVTYKDNGIGFNLDEVLNSTKGFGMFNIKNRITLLGGKINIDTSEGKGLMIKIDIDKSAKLIK